MNGDQTIKGFLISGQSSKHSYLERHTLQHGLDDADEFAHQSTDRFIIRFQIRAKGEEEENGVRISDVVELVFWGGQYSGWAPGLRYRLEVPSLKPLIEPVIRGSADWGTKFADIARGLKGIIAELPAPGRTNFRSVNQELL